MQFIDQLVERVKRLAKAGAAILASLTEDGCHLVHMAMGIAGELMEIKSAIDENDRKGLIEELGDFEFYIQGSYQGLGVPQPVVLAADPYVNVDKFYTALNTATETYFYLSKKQTIYAKPIEHSVLVEKLNGIIQVLENFYAGNSFGITRQEVLDSNRVKLDGDEVSTGRYSSGTYSDEQAVARADKEDKSV